MDMAEESSQRRPTAIPPPTRHRAPSNDEQRPPLRERVKETAKAVKKDLSARAKTAKELIGLACIPLAASAAIDTKRHEAQAQAAGVNYMSPYTLDVYTVQTHSDELATAIAELGDHYKPLGVVLDRLGSMVPGAAIFGVGLMIALQIAENHGTLSEQARAMSPFPIQSKEELAQDLIRQAAEAEAKANGHAA
jgi:hypothetical protein